MPTTVILVFADRASVLFDDFEIDVPLAVRRIPFSFDDSELRSALQQDFILIQSRRLRNSVPRLLVLSVFTERLTVHHARSLRCVDIQTDWLISERRSLTRSARHERVISSDHSDKLTGIALERIQIDAEATFLDLKNAICDAVNYDKNQMSSFFICDKSWEKEKPLLQFCRIPRNGISAHHCLNDNLGIIGQAFR